MCSSSEANPGGGVAIIVLVAPEVWLDVLRRDQANVVPANLNLSSDVMRAGARLEPDKAG
jgi:hypothetical protein